MRKDFKIIQEIKSNILLKKSEIKFAFNFSHAS